MTAAHAESDQRIYNSKVPARLDRLPWTRFHWLVIAGLGISWILDGLEITITSEVAAVLRDPNTLQLSDQNVGWIAVIYLVGEVIGALVFGQLSDRLGRRKLFLVTLGIYLGGSALTALTLGNSGGWIAYLYLTRFVAGMGIGGEYAAINSAIDELIPPYYRGRVDIAINGTYWLGATLAALANLALLNPEWLAVDHSWRIGFLIGPVIGLAIFLLRRAIPESPRWLMTHGKQADAERIVQQIETRLRSEGIKLEPVPTSKALNFTGRGNTSYRQLVKTMRGGSYRRRSFLGLSVMATQAILYNGVFFTYSQVLQDFYDIKNQDISLFFIPFALGNLAGPLVLGKLFDTIGRRTMIMFTYCTSGILLTITAWLFSIDWLDATTQTVMWCAIFFFASTGASAAYLTVSEIFPLELRAQAISFFFAISQLFGAASAYVFSYLVNVPTHGPLAAGYCVTGVIMLAGGVIAWYRGVDAERKSLEKIAYPLSAIRHTAIEPSTGSS